MVRTVIKKIWYILYLLKLPQSTVHHKLRYPFAIVELSILRVALLVIIVAAVVESCYFVNSFCIDFCHKIWFCLFGKSFLSWWLVCCLILYITSILLYCIDLIYKGLPAEWDSCWWFCRVVYFECCSFGEDC